MKELSLGQESFPFPICSIFEKIHYWKAVSMKEATAADHIFSSEKLTIMMSKTEILEELKKLTPAERLGVIETALQQLRGELQQAEPTGEEMKKQLTLAAEALYADYAADEELTAFSVLDSEDFHA
jgi:hypothetical protein